MKKLTAIILILFSLSSCGFRPLYEETSEDDNIKEVLSSVKIIPVQGRKGQIMANKIDDQLNPTSVDVDKRYNLTYRFKINEESVLVQNNNNITRYNIMIVFEYDIFDISSGKYIKTGNFRIRSSYDAVQNSYFSTIIGKEDSIDRAMTETARELKRRLIRIFKANENSTS